MSETESGYVEKFAPELSFSKNERYFPCELFLAGRDIRSNKKAYERLSENEKLRAVRCYFHVVRGDSHDAYEYWYYYAFNEYVLVPPLLISDNHDHDFEYVIVFVNKRTNRPEFLCLNQHYWHNFLRLDGTIPTICVEKGGHGLFVENKPTNKWTKGGHKLRPMPRTSLEELRRNFLEPEPHDMIDGGNKLIGENYDPLRIGKFFGPTTPWSRTKVYHLPITEILREVLPSLRMYPMLAPGLPSVQTISLPYSEPTLEENVQLAIKEKLGTPENYDTILKARRGTSK
jgi:hypothetical protein